MDMDNKKTHTSGQWTELPIQELDQIFGGQLWMGNGWEMDMFMTYLAQNFFILGW